MYFLVYKLFFPESASALDKNYIYCTKQLLK